MTDSSGKTLQNTSTDAARTDRQPKRVVRTPVAGMATSAPPPRHRQKKSEGAVADAGVAFGEWDQRGPRRRGETRGKEHGAGRRLFSFSRRCGDGGVAEMADESGSKLTQDQFIR